MTYFPVNAEFFDTVQGISFASKHGAIGSHVLVHLHRFIAKAPESYLPTSSLKLMSEIINVPMETLTEVLLELVAAGIIVYNEQLEALTTREIQESLALLKLRREVFEENKKSARAKTSAQTSSIVKYSNVKSLIEDLLKKDPSKKLYLDTVLLSDEEFASLEKRYAKDGLTKRDCQRAIELLNSWFLANLEKRAKRSCDAQALRTWPLQKVIEENGAKQKLANQQSYSKNTPNAGGGRVVGATPPRGFEVADENRAQHTDSTKETRCIEEVGGPPDADGSGRVCAAH